MFRMDLKLTIIVDIQEKLASSVFAITALALGIYTARMGTGVAGKYIEARLGKPSLVRETSRNVGVAQTLNPVPIFRRFFAGVHSHPLQAWLPSR